jgi:hypothetical protein
VGLPFRRGVVDAVGLPFRRVGAHAERRCDGRNEFLAKSSSRLRLASFYDEPPLSQ